MRLKKEAIIYLSEQILHSLKKANLIRLRVSEEMIKNKIQSFIQNDLTKEMQLEEDARKLLETYRSKMGANLDERQVLQMIKKQLAKERKIVL